ncbi:hypothetical protein D9758_012289 [Tetrapyrgos nigripes]|uniref:Uncharacterized protein n=1 Tax=Tetrapyrgos nigripes TaxID=182062 RepID=A0A8H5CHG9_9AGAR|nr:hypothetical protein D9758_012289 [Tetrapyrgos nigripes]
MHREWNPRKVRSLRAFSVPNLKLLPANRPLFHCRRCHFSNDRYHICLFCGWTSQDAEDDFQCKIQRRTLSSPYRLEFFSLHRRVQVHIPSQSVARSPESLQSIPNPIPTLVADGVALSCEGASPSLCHDYIPRTQTAPDNDNDTSGNTTIPAILPTPSHKGHARALDCQSGCRLDAEVEEAVVTATLVPIPVSVPTSTSSSGSSPVLALAATRAAVCQDDYDSSYDVDSTPSKETSIPRPEEQVSRFSNVHFSDSVDRSSTSTSLSSTSVDMTFTTTSTMNPHSATALRILADVSNSNHSVHSEIAAAPSHPDSNPCASSSNLTAASSSAQRALRHKKRQAMLHFSAPTPPSSGEANAGPSIGNKSSSSTMNTVRTTNTIRPQSHPHTQLSSASAGTVMSSDSSASIPITRIPVHSRSQSQPNVNLVLGNKERPYYSAIRKDMAITSASAVMPASLPTSTSSSIEDSSTYDVSSPSSRSSSTPPSTLVQPTSTSAAASRSAFSFSSSFSPTSSSSTGSRAHSPTSHPHSHPIFTPNPGSSRIPIPSFPSSPLPSPSPYLSPSSSSSTPWSSSSLSSSREPGSFGRPSTASRPSTSSRLSFATTSNTTSNTRPSLDSTRSVSPTPAWLFDSSITNINLKDIDNADDAELPTPVFSPPSQSPFPFLSPFSSLPTPWNVFACDCDGDDFCFCICVSAVFTIGSDKVSCAYPFGVSKTYDPILLVSASAFIFTCQDLCI